MQLGLGWIFVGAYAVENGRSIDIALLRATSLYRAPGRRELFSLESKSRPLFLVSDWTRRRTELQYWLFYGAFGTPLHQRHLLQIVLFGTVFHYVRL